MARQMVRFHIDGRDVSYKPTFFRRWVVDLVVLFCGITVFGGMEVF